MNRRTPRRRISPRTVRRYRAIKNFVRRALGSSYQPDDKTNSSISVSVLDLRQKIDGIEQQLNTVSKHCQDLVSLESRLKLKDNLNSEKDTDLDTKKINVTETKVLYKSSQDRCDVPVNDISTPKRIMRDDEGRKKLTDSNKMFDQNYSYSYKENRKSKLNHRLDAIQETDQTFHEGRNHMVSRMMSTDLPTYSSHSLNEPRVCANHLDGGYPGVHHHQRNRKKAEFLAINNGLEKINNLKKPRYDNHKHYRNKYLRPELDQDFIADIIKRQYRPVKLFGRRESDFSQFSAPICRDQEYSIKETIQEGSDLCSCCHDKNNRRHRHSKYLCNNDLSDMRSICDTRLYSSRRHKHQTSEKKRINDFYNDSSMYDVIPVKEKASPKSRRKFIEDNILINDNYREVPPSPRTQRPRLNLQAQFHTEDDADGILLEKQLRRMKRSPRKSIIKNEGNFSNMSSEVFIHNRNFKGIQNTKISNNSKPFIEACIGTTSNVQYPILSHDLGVINNDTTLNTPTTDISAVKTDKTLSEIKNILQSFLLEIKKESSQSGKINTTPQSDILPNLNEAQEQIKINSFNNNNFAHCGLPPFVQSFPNSCCCPLLPICPINCMQNGFSLPSPSFTCATCANNSKEQTCENNDLKNKTNSSEDTNSETQKLLKEIHHLISQNPNSAKRKEIHNDKLPPTNKNEEVKTVTSRSVGGSSKTSKHDAKVGTTKLKCHSKSCEALGSRATIGARYGTNVSYSDTVLEKGSGEGTTASTSESEYSSESMIMEKKKGNKFAKILRSIGILKRNKTDVIEELTESDNSMDITKPKPRSAFQSHPNSPFQQHIINYNMHGQKYFHPPVTSHHQHQYGHCGHSSQYDPSIFYSPTTGENKVKTSQRRYLQEQDMLAQLASPRDTPIPMCANYYDPHYVNVSPQVPVCFKEIEVKSIGTQSVRKISLLQKFTNKMQGPVQQAREPSPKQSSTRSSSKEKNLRSIREPTLFDWKKIHEKAMQKTTDPLKFSYNTQKRLAEGDNTMRNVMLKKLFYKRNPFSPRNLLVRTLLGKDKSSFGEPPKMYKPKMFL